MADGQASSPSVSYLTNPSDMSTMHHSNPLNLILMAATATVVTLLCLFLAAITYYFLRRRYLKRKKEEQARSEATISKLSHFGLSQSAFGSDHDLESSRHSRTTCDSCSTRLRNSRAVLPRHSTLQRPSRPLHSSFVMADDGAVVVQEAEKKSPTKYSSVQLNQDPNQDDVVSPTLEQVLTDYKAAGVFDWDRCDFEDQEEKSMWLSSRPHSFAISSTLQKSQIVVHNRACSESATLALSNENIPKITKTIAWNDSASMFNAQDSPTSDYFGIVRPQESSLSTFSPRFPYNNLALYSPSIATSSDLNLPLPISPMVVHSPQRQSYCVRAETQDWEAHAETEDRVEGQHANRLARRTFPASNSSFYSNSKSHNTHPLVQDRAPLKALSKSSPNGGASNICLSPLRITSTSESNALCSSPLSISVYSHMSSPSHVEDSCEYWPPRVEVLHGDQSKGNMTLTKSFIQKKAATDISPHSPMKLHRYSRRGALSSSDWPVQHASNRGSIMLPSPL